MELIRSKKPNSNSDDNLIPLINIVFLLLIFFMVAGQMQKPLATDITLPVSQGVTAAAAPEISSLRRWSIGSGHQCLQHGATVNASGRRVAGPFRVRHQSENIASRVGDAGDVTNRAVRILPVAQGNGIVVLQLSEGLLAALIPTFPMGDRQGQLP